MEERSQNGAETAGISNIQQGISNVQGEQPGVRERVLRCIADQVGLEVADFSDPARALTDASSLVDDVGFDSLDMIELEMSIETEFSCSVNDAQVARWHTIGDVVTCMERMETRT